MTDLPPPLTPPDCDLRNFPSMLLDVVRLRDSEMAAVPDAEGFRAAVMLWCAAWHQIPAASLPDDDSTLCRFAGYGRDIRTWKRAKTAGAMRGWVKCSDGRLYHPVVAEKALEAIDAKAKQRARTEGAREAKELARLAREERLRQEMQHRAEEQQRSNPTESVAISVTEPETTPVTESVTTSTNPMSQHPREGKGREVRKKDINLPSDAETASAGAAAPSPPPEPAPSWPPPPLATSPAAVIGSVVADLTGRRRGIGGTGPQPPALTPEQQIAAAGGLSPPQPRGVVSPEQLAEIRRRGGYGVAT